MILSLVCGEVGTGSGRITGVFIGDTDGVFSKGLLLLLLSRSTIWKVERLDDGRALTGMYWVLVALVYSGSVSTSGSFFA
jgi:hypothetical protein